MACESFNKSRQKIWQPFENDSEFQCGKNDVL